MRLPHSPFADNCAEDRECDGAGDRGDYSVHDVSCPQDIHRLTLACCRCCEEPDRVAQQLADEEIERDEQGAVAFEHVACACAEVTNDDECNSARTESDEGEGVCQDTDNQTNESRTGTR